MVLQAASAVDALLQNDFGVTTGKIPFWLS